jgi:hypothetical protein
MSIAATILEDRLYSIVTQYKKVSHEELFNQIEETFNDYLRKFPKDTEVWMRYALFLNISIVDYSDKSVEILKTLIEENGENARALLLLADIQDFSIGRITEKVAQWLHDFKTDNTEIMSMIEYAKGRFSFYYDKKEYEKYLIRSIKYCQRHVNNHKELGIIYLERGEIKQGSNSIKSAIRNTLSVFPYTNPYIGSTFDIPTTDEYLAEFITGTMKPQSTFEDLCKTYANSCDVNIIKNMQQNEV